MATWEPNTEEDIAGYRIHFGTESGKYERKIDIKKVNNYTLKSLANDTQYYITLTAYDMAGNESPYSTEASGKIVEADITPPIFSAIMTDRRIARPNTLVKIFFKSSEALSSNPVVTVNGKSVKIRMKWGSRYAYIYTQ